jgi:group I intron endonuclease
MGYIYKITHKESGKSYVGQTIHNLEIRWKHHLRPQNNCRYLSRAIQKYGKDAFEFKLICICFDEDLDTFEKDYMKKYNTMAPNGFNLREGGNGGKQHEDTKKKISDTLKKTNKEHPRLDNKLRGRKLPEEHKKNISKTLLGHIKTEDTRKKLSEVNKKYKVLQYTLEGVLLNTYESGVDAANHMNSTKSHISSACRKNIKHKGFVWKYMDRTTNEILVFENNVKL